MQEGYLWCQQLEGIVLRGRKDTEIEYLLLGLWGRACWWLWSDGLATGVLRAGELCIGHFEELLYLGEDFVHFKGFS